MDTSSNSPFRGLGDGCFFLIGFMGSGKTHWGRLWAAHNNLRFFDLDHVIEKEEQRTIAAIFETEGEDYFRKKETEVLQQLSVQENCIISCGGGTPCFNNNMEWMNEHGTTVYLSATVNDILKRVINEKDHRPIFNNVTSENLPHFIENKLKERAPFYNQAKIILPVNDIELNTFNSINKPLV
ncbi:MAG: shikimate kinase [Ferruginibacter sp.]